MEEIKSHVAPKKTRRIVSLAIVDGTNAEVGSPRRVLDFEQASARSAESAAWDLPRERRIFQFDEASLNSTNSSFPTTTTNSVRTMTERSNDSVVNENDAGSTAGIFEDHPGLNPTDERVVEYQAAIHEEMGRLMIGRDPQDILAAAERVHGESDNIEFMRGQLQDLLDNGIESEAFKYGVVDLANEVENFAAMNLVESPLDQFSIHPILDLHMGNYYFSFTNPSLSMLLTLGLVLLLLFVITKKGGGKSVPNAWQSLVELIYDFVPNLVNEQIGGISGNVKQKFFPCISVTFTFSLFRNPQGDLGPLFIVLALTGLELGVAISQAHVSTISICIYLNDATNLHQNE
ncbi:ATP synthase subunit, putative [Panicum miliaceum]|uniref:F-ATPase protein 6 n=1 Tax=Panicum miliaceum TaxID=4540 RepID=A0A3L6PWX7_PANMI|nr:ATP synthase subunit, putative [Panicum miliaceum]